MAPDWPVSDAARAAAPPAAIADLTVTYDQENCLWRLFAAGDNGPAASDPEPYDNIFGLTHDLIGRLVDIYCERGEAVAHLHAGAVKVGGRLVLFLGDGFAGKSTLCLAMAHQGFTFFTDDALPVQIGDDGAATGTALQLTPKMRLPLPADMPGEVKDFLQDHQLAQIGDFMFVDPDFGNTDTPVRARFGEQCEIGALIVLQREDADAGENRVELVETDRATVIKHLTDQTYARHWDAATLLARLSTLTAQTRCLRLVYNNSAAAAEFLKCELLAKK